MAVRRVFALLGLAALMSDIAFTPEATLLFALLHADDRATAQKPDNIDWHILFDLASTHGLLPLLHLALSARPEIDAPEAFRHAVSEHYRANALRNRLLRQEFKTMLALFAAANVRVVPMKGVVYAGTIYDDPAARAFSDIDFLVRESDIERARETLVHNGFRDVFSWTTDAGRVGMTTAQAAVYRKVYHEYALESADGLIHVDLHWRLSPTVYPTALPTALAWDNLIEAELYGASVHIVRHEIDVLYLCLHAAKDGWSELKWAVDLNRIITSCPNLDWDKIERWASQLKCQTMLLVGLAITHRITGAALPPFAATALANTSRAATLAQTLLTRLIFKPQRKFSFVPCLGLNTTYITLCDTATEKLTYIYRMLTYPQARDFDMLGLSEQTLWAWPVLRPLRLSAYCLRKAAGRQRRPP